MLRWDLCGKRYKRVRNATTTATAFTITSTVLRVQQHQQEPVPQLTRNTIGFMMTRDTLGTFATGPGDRLTFVTIKCD
jgi:hypothetical protein